MPAPSSPAKVALIRTLRIDYDPKANPSDPNVIRGKFTIPPEYDNIVARCHAIGPQCTVCKATFRHDRDGREEDVALKIVSRRNAEELIAREIRAWRELRHSRVLPLYGHCTLESHIVLVSPWMKRGNLLEHIRANPDVDRQELLVQAAHGLLYLHDTKRLVHGDIKAENVLITQTGNVLLADFGLSTHVAKSPGANTTATDIRGRFTLRFCAPEMLEDDVMTVSPSGHLTVTGEAVVARMRSKSLKTDVYAFGMLMLQTFTGVSPWHNLTDLQVVVHVTSGKLPPIHGEAEAVRHGMNRAYRAVCKLCWSKQPCDRPTMAEVREWLDLHRDGGGDRLLTSPTEQDDSVGIVASPSTPSSATSSEASGPKRRQWIQKVRQQLQLQDGDGHIPWYSTHARRSSVSSSSASPAADATSEELSSKADKHNFVRFVVPKKAIRKASVVVPVARAATRQLWQALREHFELYDGKTDAGYYPYQWQNLASPTLVDEESNEESLSSEPMQRTRTPDTAPDSFLDL